MIGSLDRLAQVQEGMPSLPFGFWRDRARPARNIDAGLSLKLEELRVLAPKRRQIFVAISKVMALPAREMRRGVQDRGASAAFRANKIGAVAKVYPRPGDANACHDFVIGAKADGFNTSHHASIAQFSDVNRGRTLH